MDKGEGLFDKLVPGLQGQEVKSQVMDSADSKGSLTVKLPKEKTLEVGITFSRSPEQGVELSKTRILQKFLDSLKNKKLKRKLPPTFQSIQAMREDLYLVTETLKTTKTVILKSEKQYILGDPMKCFGLQYEHKVRILGELSEEGQLVAEALDKGTLPLLKDKSEVQYINC
eukprot:bmy_12749T0